MAEPPQGEHFATNTIEAEQTTNGDMSPAKESIVEISDDSTNQSTDGTSRATSSLVEVVNDNSDKAAGDRPPASSSMEEVAKDDSKKRKAADHDETTPSKKQKPAPPENSGKKADGDAEKDGDDGAESTAAASGSPKDSQQESTAASRTESQKPKPQYGSIDEVREKANRILHGKKAEIIELQAKVVELEDEKDQWQNRAGRSEAKLKTWKDTQEVLEKNLWKKAKDWKKLELEKEVEEARQKLQKAQDKAKASWQKKCDTAEEKHDKEVEKLQTKLDAANQNFLNAVNDLKAARESHKKELREAREKVKDAKPGASKELKEKIKELQEKDNLLAAKDAAHHSVTLTLGNQNDDLERIRAQRAEITRKANHFHSEWTKQMILNDQLRAENKEKMRKQLERWQVQADNSAESQVRVVALQRVKLDLNNANERLNQEKDQLRKEKKALTKQLHDARAQIQQLRTSAAPQSPRPAQVLPTPSDTIRTPTSRLQEMQAEDTSASVDNGTESRAVAAPPEAEVTSQREAAESRAKTEVDATVDNDRQVTQIVNELVNGDAQPPRGEPHSDTFRLNIGSEAAGDVEMNVEPRKAVDAAAEVQPQDMQTARDNAGDFEEGEALNGVVTDQMQDVQTAGDYAGHAEGDETFDEVSEDQMQNIQAAVQNAGEHAGHAQDQSYNGVSEAQVQDMPFAHHDTSLPEEDAASQATDETERVSPEIDVPRSAGLFGFNLPSVNMWRSDRNGGSSA